MFSVVASESRPRIGGSVFPHVDIGIPAHGRARFLIVAVESVLAQTFPGWRLTIREDGRGELFDAVRPYLSDCRIEFVSSGAPVGAAANASWLLRRGTAPYVALLHDDDCWDPGWLARRVAFLDEHAECGFAFGTFREIDAEDEALGVRRRRLTAGVVQPAQLAAALIEDNVVGPTTPLIRRSALEAVGARFDPSFPTIYDYELIVRLATRFPAGYLGVCDSSWRRHGNQSSAENYDREAEYRLFLDRFAALLEQELPELGLTESMRKRRLGGWLRYMALNAVERGDRRSARRLLRRSVLAHPPEIVNPKLAAGAVASVTGKAGTRVLAGARARLRRSTLGQKGQARAD
jgi:glycosyltransferase involved in cell wall biosynthesis